MTTQSINNKLYLKAGGKCSFPNCKLDLIIDSEGYANIGEVAHIESDKNIAPGPRFNQKMKDSKIEYENYDNKICLCRNHHKIIDSNTDEYTVPKLKEMRKKHEKWIINHPEKIKSEHTLKDEFEMYIKKSMWVNEQLENALEQNDSVKAMEILTTSTTVYVTNFKYTLNMTDVYSDDW